MKDMKYAFFPGCMIQIRYPQMEAAVRKTVPQLGIELVDLLVYPGQPGIGCRGVVIASCRTWQFQQEQCENCGNQPFRHVVSPDSMIPIPPTRLSNEIGKESGFP